MTDRNKLDYLIIQTGYTSRIISRLGFDKIDCIKKNALTKKNGKPGKKGHSDIFKVGYSFDYKTKEGISKIMATKFGKKLDDTFNFIADGDDAIEEFSRFMDSLIYVYDDLWGTGLYNVSDNDQEINKIMSILDAKGIGKDGTICFRCDARKDITFFTNIIKKLDYCQMFEYLGDEYVDTDELVITVASFDSESG